MRICRVADFVHGLYGRIDGRIESNGKISAEQVIVNRAGNTQDRNIGILLDEQVGAGERAVATNSDQGINVIINQVFIGLFAAFRRHKPLTASRFQDSAAAVNNITHVIGFQAFDRAVDHALITPHNTINMQVIIESITHDCPYGGIHAWCVATRSEYGNTFDIFSHNIFHAFLPA